MSDKSSIEWTATVHPDGSVTPGATWNPVRGCVKVSPGCAHCYAEVFAERFRGVKGHPYEQGFDLRLVPEKLAEPLSWKKPRRVFVNSMSDLFQDGVPDAYIDRVFSVMGLAPQHTFQVLTKRPDRMRQYMISRPASPTVPGEVNIATESGLGVYHVRWPLPNVQLGVSVENQHFADERIPLLLQTPAAVRFISAEPLLEAVTLKPRWLRCPECKGSGTHDCQNDRLVAHGEPGPCPWPDHLDWAIVGGESGPNSRPMDLAWARSIVAQCKAAGIACFVKQLGANPVGDFEADGQTVWTIQAHGLRDKKGGDMAEWPEDLRVREFPEVAHG